MKLFSVTLTYTFVFFWGDIVKTAVIILTEMLVVLCFMIIAANWRSFFKKKSKVLFDFKIAMWNIYSLISLEYDFNFQFLKNVFNLISNNFALCVSRDYWQILFSHVFTSSKLRFSSHDVFVWPCNCFILSAGPTLVFISAYNTPFYLCPPFVTLQSDCVLSFLRLFSQASLK